MMRHDDDTGELVTRAQRGDDDAFRGLVEGHSRGVYRLAYRLTGSHENAEDVVQETFLRAHRALHRFDHRCRFSTWLHRIATNCALDLLRRADRRPQEAGDDDFDTLSSEAPGPERLTLSTEIQIRVREGLAQLTPLERTAFVLRHFEQRSIAEIGQVLGSRANATKQAIFRAVAKLRRELGPWLEENHVRTA